jgi:8-oxo-dGTP pyrophosphatase MutT (NUDIX family)
MDRPSIKRILDNRTRLVIPPGNLKQAAVLLPLAFDGSADHIFFIQRSHDVLYHKGQVSFPGGGVEKCDADLLSTALRESDEEIGLKPEDVEVLGRLDDQVTVSGFVITPWVGAFPLPYTFKLCDFEVKEVFSLPVPHLLDSRLCRQGENLLRENKTAPGYAFDCQGRFIWGATARILKQFLELVRAAG